MLLGNGDGTFQEAISGPSAVYSGEAVIKDFDGDGKTDIVLGTYGGLAFLDGNGDGTFEVPVYPNSPVHCGYFWASLQRALKHADLKAQS